MRRATRRLGRASSTSSSGGSTDMREGGLEKKLDSVKSCSTLCEGGTDSADSSDGKISVCFLPFGFCAGGAERGTEATATEESAAGNTSAEGKNADEMPLCDERGTDLCTAAEGRPEREEGGSDFPDGRALLFLPTETSVLARQLRSLPGYSRTASLVNACLGQGRTKCARRGLP